MTDLQELLARLEAATGPDRELDALLRVTLFGWRKCRIGAEFYGYDAGEFWVPPSGLPAGYPLQPIGPTDPLHYAKSYHPRDKLDYTASIDAALALVESVLPGWMVAMQTSPRFASFACLNDVSLPPSERASAEGRARELPLAILIALVRAKIAETANAV